MQQEPFEKRAHDDDNVFPAKIASSRRRIGSGPAFLVSASHYTPRRQALSQSRTRRETNGAFVHVQERKLYGEGGCSCFWALREAHRKPIVRDLRVVVGAERAGKAFRECHRCQTSSAEASSNASSSATTTTARKQRNPRRRGGGRRHSSSSGGGKPCSSSASRNSVGPLFVPPAVAHSPRVTEDKRRRPRRAAERRVFSGSPPGAAEAALCAGLGRTSYPRRHRRPLLRPLRLAVRPRGPACIACPETSWRHYSRPKETSAKIDRRPPCPLMRETPLIGLEKKQLSA